MNKTGILLIILGAMSYGFLSTLVKLAYRQGYNVFQVTGIQTLLGALILWFVVFITRSSFKSVDKKQLVSLVLLGCSTGLVSIFYYSAIQYVSVSFGVVLLFQFTWMGMLIDSLEKGKWPSLNRVLSVVLILLGTFLASGFLENQQQKYSWQGIGFGLCAALCYTAFIYFNNKYGKGVSPQVKSALMVTGAMITVCIVFFVSSGVFVLKYLFDGTFTGGLWKIGTLLALMCMVIPPFLYAKGMPKVPIGLATVLVSIELPMAVLVSSILLNERATALQWTGVFVILGASAFSAFRQDKKA